MVVSEPVLFITPPGGPSYGDGPGISKWEQWQCDSEGQDQVEDAENQNEHRSEFNSPGAGVLEWGGVPDRSKLASQKRKPQLSKDETSLH